MDLPEAPLAGEVLRNAHAKSSHKLVVRVAATFALVTAFALAGASTATAGTETGDCEGHRPGCCYSAPR